MIATRFGVDRCLRYAFELCRRRKDKMQLTLVHKTNVLTYAANLWERAFHAMGPEYPDVTLDYNHIDAALHVVREEPGVLRHGRGAEHVRGHHHRHRRHDSGRPGRERRRQHQPGSGRLQHVRVHGRFGAEVHGQERDQPDRRHSRHGDAAVGHGRAEGAGQPDPRVTAGRERDPGHHAEDARACRPAGWAIPPPRSATWWPPRFEPSVYAPTPIRPVRRDCGSRMAISTSRPRAVSKRRRRSREYSRKLPRRSRDTSGWDSPSSFAASICLSPVGSAP